MVTSKTLPKVKQKVLVATAVKSLVESNPNLKCVAEETDTRLFGHM